MINPDQWRILMLIINAGGMSGLGDLRLADHRRPLVGAVKGAIAITNRLIDWALATPAVERPWRWGDPPRGRGPSCEAIATYIAGVGFFLGCLVFAARAAGLE